MSSKNSFNYLFLKRFLHLFHVFLPFSRLSLNIHNYNEHFYSHPLFLILLIISNEIGLQATIYFVDLLPGQFYFHLSKSPNERDLPIFRLLFIRAFGFVALNAILKSLSTFLSSILHIKWRIRLTFYLHSFYFTKQHYYRILNPTDQDTIDNPDQRITQDVDSLCRSLSSILPLLLGSPFIIGFYTYRTWIVTGYYGPLIILIYFLLWTIVNKFFISAVSRTIFQQNKFEGNFRFLHTQIRTYNESIAFYDGGSFENRRFDNYFLKSVSPILYRRTKQEFYLNLSTNLYNYIASILTYLLLSLAIFVFRFYDNLTINELIQKISQTSSIIGYLIFRFNLLNDLADELTSIAANTHRIQSFIEYMKNLDIKRTEKRINKTIQQNEILIIENLSYSTPNNNKHILMQNLNLTLNQGQRLLITGDSGVGKTSLIRVLHSIWPINIQGSFSYRSDCAYLLPQRPYFTNRCLYDELSYPNIENMPKITSQNEIEQYLREWNLLNILNFVQSDIYKCPNSAWQDLLSPGELQRLSFLRLIVRLSLHEIYPKINFVFLDEITSAIDKKMEMKIYNYLIEQNLTMISIGHRETIRQYHQIELQINENGNYLIKNIVE